MRTMMIVAMMAMMMTGNHAPVVQEATAVITYDNTMVVEMSDGNCEFYLFDGMTEEEKNAEYVLLIDNEVVAVR